MHCSHIHSSISVIINYLTPHKTCMTAKPVSEFEEKTGTKTDRSQKIGKNTEKTNTLIRGEICLATLSGLAGSLLLLWRLTSKAIGPFLSLTIEIGEMTLFFNRQRPTEFYLN